MTNINDIHVISREGRWVILQEGRQDIIQVADNIGAAVKAARQEARKIGAAIVVHKGPSGQGEVPLQG